MNAIINENKKERNVKIGWLKLSDKYLNSSSIENKGIK
jgi:hypothetical protein